MTLSFLTLLAIFLIAIPVVWISIEKRARGSVGNREDRDHRGSDGGGDAGYYGDSGTRDDPDCGDGSSVECGDGGGADGGGGDGGGGD